MARVKAAVFLADGFEEVEAVTTIDYLRRAGIEVIVAGVATLTPCGSKKITLSADAWVDEIQGPFDAVILPGGIPGADNLAASGAVKELCVSTMENGGLVAAICAAPAVALATFGLLDGRRFTCYPGYEQPLKTGKFQEDRVVVDANLITSRGPGTAGSFALAIIRYLVGDDIADRIAQATLVNL